MDPDKLQQLFEQQLKLMEVFTTSIGKLSKSSKEHENIRPSVDAATNGILEFHYDPEASITFDSWFRRYEGLFNDEFAQQEDSWKVRLLLRKLGAAEFDKYSNLVLPKSPHDINFKETVKSLRSIFDDNCSLFNTRYNCLNLVMKDGDDFMTHVGTVNRECEKFKIGSLTTDQFKSLILISSLRSTHLSDVRTRLLNLLEKNTELTLNDIAEEFKRLTNLKQDASLIQTGGQCSLDVHAIRHASKHGPHESTSSGAKASNTRHSSVSDKQPPTACWLCGAWHFVRFCPFKNHHCRQCNRTGHKEGHCNRSKPITSPGRVNQHPFRGKRRKSVGVSRSLLATFQISAPGRRKYITVLINGYNARLQLDTASDITIISEETWRALGQPTVATSNQTAISACGGRLRLLGQLKCCVSFRGTTFDGTCFITKHDLNLLGLDWFEALGLSDLSISSLCNAVRSPKASEDESAQINREFASVFQPGLGICSVTQATLRLQPGANPVFRPKRPVPYASISQVDAELQRLEREGVLVPVSYSTWAAPIVVVKKPNGTIRICADFSTGLNAALEQHHYPLPVPDDLFTILNGGTCFAKLDLAEAYLQIEVAPESRELLTINTHRGLFQYTRLPFGIKTAPSIFQQLMDTILSGIPGVATYLDDVLIVARSRDELRDRINTVLQRIQDSGLRLRPEKCQFFLNSVKYLGFIFDSSGRHPDPENIRAIQQMPAPKDVSELRSFLGLISYYSAFLPSMHNVRPTLNKLLGKDVPWEWSSACESSFCQLKAMLSSDLLLTHYDPTLPITIAADASAYGVGAVIIHHFPDNTEKAIMHASRSLTPAEQKYGQIEKEALALVFAVKRFHKLVYGRRFTLLTDHKPLLAIFGSKSGIPAHSANRLQRWALTLLGYDFDIQYRRTEDFGQADALSRLISNHPNPEEDAVIAALAVEDSTQQSFVQAVRGLPVTAADIKQATLKDDTLQQVIRYTLSHWPSASLSRELQQFYHRRESLSIVNSCLMFGERVVVPQSLHNRVLRQFHSGHPGISRMKSIARSFIYWPDMDRHIIDFVNKCDKCQQAAKNPSRVTPVPWPLPQKPWSRIHIDFAGPINGVSYLVVVDAYSKWPEIVSVSPPTTTGTIKALTHMFGQHGLPETIVSDNGTQFTSREFQDFCKTHAITHIRSPPYHPQSNGQAERFVDTFKRALLKARGEGATADIIERFLLVYRSTASTSVPDNKTPAEALMGRKLRIVHDALLPISTVVSSSHSDRSFKPGDHVFVRNYRFGKEQWVPGTIKRRKGSVLYDVAIADSIWSRHMNQIRRRHTITPEAEQDTLPLDVLLDTFNLPNNAPSAKAELRSMARRSTRPRRPTQHLVVNPRRKRY